MGAPKRQRPTFYLAIAQPNGDKQVIVWDTVDITVGRSTNQDIVVADPEVSREHAVFRRHGDACEVQDLNTGLGTSVDGRSIKVHPLQHGNVVRIGTLEIAFGQSAQPIARAKNVRFASELKEFGFAALDDAAGRTMLGFDTGDDLLQAARSASASASSPRAVTAEGRVELATAGAGAFDLGADEVSVRNLDLDLAAELPPGESAPAADPPLRDASAADSELAISAATVPKLDTHARAPEQPSRPAAQLEPLAIDAIQKPASHSPRSSASSSAKSDSKRSPATSGATLTTAKMVLEVRGPAEQVEAFLDAIRDRRIELSPIELLVRDI
ncbi:MAG TPA: FHA domain-containing protein [Myxococcota bacterium]|nr:FHA domain-containing protein [Myxococcota bacterium]